MTRRFWTEAERDEVRRRYPHERTADIARDLNRSAGAVFGEAFSMGLHKTPEFMRTIHCAQLKQAGIGHRFHAAQTPWNKGIPGSTGNHPNTQRTQFKAGRRPEEARNYRPIGSLRIGKDGLLQRKITDDQSIYPSQRWRSVHRIVWEEVNGDVPRGHVVVFKPGMDTTDPELITIDRVELITRAELMRRNTRHNLPEEIKELVILKYRITRAINRRFKHEAQH